MLKGMLAMENVMAKMRAMVAISFPWDGNPPVIIASIIARVI